VPDDSADYAETLHRRRQELCRESELRLERVLTLISAYHALLEQMTAKLRALEQGETPDAP
jgi:hypothetical protein